MENRYWDNTGAEQAKYNEMIKADFEFTAKSESVFHSYYRYYNDGDLPGWARSRWDITRFTNDYGYFHKTLTDDGEDELERRVTERVNAEYKRFLKSKTAA